jgi:hypothetical protein
MQCKGVKYENREGRKGCYADFLHSNSPRGLGLNSLIAEKSSLNRTSGQFRVFFNRVSAFVSCATAGN